jgi:hypothetical protein
MNSKVTLPTGLISDSPATLENHLAPYLLGLAMRASGKKNNQSDLARAGAEAVLKHGKFVKKV